MPAATATDDTQQMAARCVDEQQPHLAQTLLPKALVPLTGPAGTGSERGSQMCAMLDCLHTYSSVCLSIYTDIRAHTSAAMPCFDPCLVRLNANIHTPLRTSLVSDLSRNIARATSLSEIDIFKTIEDWFYSDETSVRMQGEFMSSAKFRNELQQLWIFTLKEKHVNPKQSG